MNSSQKNRFVEESKRALIEATSIFLCVDKDLPMNVHERTSVARIAHYLANIIETQQLFKENRIFVDVEYNRNENFTKKLFDKDIFPDLIIHQRGNNGNDRKNILICEFKNEINSISDRQRIKRMVQSDQYGYLVGTTLIINALRNSKENFITVDWIEKDGDTISFEACQYKLTK